MKTIFIVVAAISTINAATLKEKRTVKDSSGKTFECTYSISYNKKTVSKPKSSVNCSPKANGKVVTQEFFIESLGKTATVKHTIRRGKGSISAITLKDYVAPTPSPPPPSPSPSTTTGEGNNMNCSCRLPGMGGDVMGRMSGKEAFERKILIKPLATAASRGKGHGGYYGSTGVSSGLSSLLSSVIPLALAALLAGIVAAGGTTLLTTLVNTFFSSIVNIIGRKLPMEELAETEDQQARLLAKLNDRQLFGNLLGGLNPPPAPAAPAPSGILDLSSLLGGASNGGALDLASLLGGGTSTNDLVAQVAAQVVQQQINEFIGNGGAEAALNNFIESGQMEEMVNNMVENAAANINTDEIMANLEENLSEINGGIDELLNEANLEELMGSFKLEDLMTEMEMEMQCSCIPS